MKVLNLTEAVLDSVKIHGDNGLARDEFTKITASFIFLTAARYLKKYVNFFSPVARKTSGSGQDEESLISSEIGTPQGKLLRL